MRLCLLPATRETSVTALLAIVLLVVSNVALAQKGGKLQVFHEDDALNFFVIGDWGRNGQFNQKEVASAMASTADKIEPEFIISTGDNFYPNGVASVNDPLWHSSFEDIYTAHRLHCNWFNVLGNHDYRGNPQAQIEYQSIARRWNLPSRYYTIERTLETGEKVLFVFIDTNPLIRDYYKDLTKYRLSGQDSAVQYRWIDSVLKNNRSEWKIVVGHHNLYTGGKRKPGQRELIENLEPVFEKYGVQAYFNGHEHDLQVINPRNKVTYFCSGAGSEIRASGTTDGTKFQAAKAGFMVVSLQSDQMVVQVIDKTSALLYTERVPRIRR